MINSEGELAIPRGDFATWAADYDCEVLPKVTLWEITGTGFYRSNARLVAQQ